MVFGHSWNFQQHVPGWHYFQVKRRPRLVNDDDVGSAVVHDSDVKEAEVVAITKTAVVVDKQPEQVEEKPKKVEEKPKKAVEEKVEEKPKKAVEEKKKNVFADLRREGVVLEEPRLSSSSRERNIPSSPLGRLASFGSLALNLGVGAAGEALKRSVMGGQPVGNSVFISERNAQVLVDSLCKMRGAALKIGQFLSIQDEGVIPKELVQIFDRVRQDADVMPAKKVEAIVRNELGEDWRSRILSFDDKPIAAASIGQVHKLVLSDGTPCVMKIQYPGVARSIESDVNNLTTLLNLTNLVPPGMYLEKALSVLSKELALECDYVNEARNQMRMKELVERDVRDGKFFNVPRVIENMSTERILTSEFVSGIRVEGLMGLPQEARDRLGELIMILCLKELFVWRFMQVDPNFSNFLLDPERERINLLDFGACLKFEDSWVDKYKGVIVAAAENDRAEVLRYSTELGFLTGKESEAMKRAHVDSVLALGMPFQTRGKYDFASQKVTSTVQSNVPTMINERLTPPPPETYSLHRKLAGSFLLCTKLKACVDVRSLLFDAVNQPHF